MAITLEDIAQKAGVSVSTVSKIINRKGRISEQTRDRVFQVADQMGYYKKNKKKETKIKRIGILFNNFYQDFFSNPFYGSVWKGLEEYLKEYDYFLTVKTLSGNFEQDDLTLEKFLSEEEVAGIILIGYEISPDISIKIKKRGVPLVLIDNNLWDEEIDCVLSDNLAGARRIIKHLIDLGHEKIAFFGGPPDHKSLKNRFAGYKLALKEAELPVREELILFLKINEIKEKKYKKTEGEWAVSEILKKAKTKPTAFFGVNDYFASSIIKALHKEGFSVPGDFSVVGYDDQIIAQHTTPALTTVRINKEMMGVYAGRRMRELINHGYEEPIKITLSAKPVIRESTARLISK